MADVELTVGDTYRPVEATLLDTDGSSMNLVGAEVWFHVENSFSDADLFDSKAVITDAESGTVRYDFTAADVADAGYYEGKFRVVFGATTDDPEQQHFPNDDDITISIQPE